MTTENKTRAPIWCNRAIVTQERDTALMNILRNYNLVLPKNAVEWRATRNPNTHEFRKGSHKQLFSTLTLLCTDGVVAFALLGDNETIVHIQLSAFVERMEDIVPANFARKTVTSKAKARLKELTSED